MSGLVAYRLALGLVADGLVSWWRVWAPMADGLVRWGWRRGAGLVGAGMVADGRRYDWRGRWAK